jgi:hypothetical protein
MLLDFVDGFAWKNGAQMPLYAVIPTPVVISAILEGKRVHSMPARPYMAWIHQKIDQRRGDTNGRSLSPPLKLAPFIFSITKSCER